MSNEDKMLQLVLSDNNLSSFYEYNAADYQSVLDALQSDNPVVVAVAKIIRGISGIGLYNGNKKEIYNEVFNYLNQNLL
ncbi:MAG: hypothetical protein LBH32_14395 [Dysgonamonadaceae bacterium]|jgi:hypothetical protein|nr:hypothetical protein [Dysgonamonadaceae bacterium]